MEKRRISIRLTDQLIERMRNAAYYVPGLTISALVDKAIGDAVGRVEKAHNDGKPFQTRGSELRAGRPLGM